jgi:Tfp pilus assembly protein PilZ
VFVQTYRDLPVGSDVEVLFELPDGQLKAHGCVRWHRDNSDSSPPGVGIAFEKLGEDDRQVIQRFCEQRAPLYYDVEHG